MAIDLTFFNKVHENNVQFASKNVQAFLKSYEEQCCPGCKVYHKYTVPVSDMSEAKFDILLDMMVDMFHSSGFWSKFEMTKNKNDYEVTLCLKTMSTKEKEKALFIPDNV